MNVKIREEEIVINDKSLRYYPYYFNRHWQDEGLSGPALVKKVLSQWAEALIKMDEDESVFLPHSLEDEWVECLRANLSGERVVLRCVWVNWSGHSVDLDDISEFMFYEHEVVKEYSDVFGEYDRKELAAALQGAEIIRA